MNVHWTHNSTNHLVDIYDFISKDSKYFARRMVDRITKRSEQIAFEPLSGRIVPEYQDSNVREIFEGPYRIIYDRSTLVFHGILIAFKKIMCNKFQLCVSIFINIKNL